MRTYICVGLFGVHYPYLVEVSAVVQRHLVLKRVPLRYFYPVLEKYSHSGVDVQRVYHRHPTVSLGKKKNIPGKREGSRRGSGREGAGLSSIILFSQVATSVLSKICPTFIFRIATFIFSKYTKKKKKSRKNRFFARAYFACVESERASGAGVFCPSSQATNRR